MKIVIYIVLACLWIMPGKASDKAIKQYDSYKGLIMAGYQGWFNAPDDGAGRGWYHYRGKDGFKPGSCSVDFWPDVSEYNKTRSHTDGFQRNNAKCLDEKGISRFVPHSSI